MGIYFLIIFSLALVTYLIHDLFPSLRSKIHEYRKYVSSRTILSISWQWINYTSTGKQDCESNQRTIEYKRINISNILAADWLKDNRILFLESTLYDISSLNFDSKSNLLFPTISYLDCLPMKSLSDVFSCAVKTEADQHRLGIQSCLVTKLAVDAGSRKVSWKLVLHKPETNYQDDERLYLKQEEAG